MKNLIIASGYFNPLSYHHLDYLKAAKYLFDTPTQNFLIVVVNNDIQVKLKNSISFLDEMTRWKIIDAIKYVDRTVPSIDEDESISKTIETIYNSKIGDIENLFFVNGGPQIVSSKEVDICNRLNIKCLYGIGGKKKIESSSWLIERAAKKWIRRKLELDIDD